MQITNGTRLFIGTRVASKSTVSYNDYVQVASMASGQWAAGYALLGEIDLHSHLLGVNDDAASVAAATFAGQMDTIASKILSAMLALASC